MEPKEGGPVITFGRNLGVLIVVTQIVLDHLIRPAGDVILQNILHGKLSS